MYIFGLPGPRVKPFKQRQFPQRNDKAPYKQPPAHPQALQRMLPRETLRQIKQGSCRLRRLQRYIRYKHSASDTNLTLQDKYMFDLVHSEQEEG